MSAIFSTPKYQQQQRLLDDAWISPGVDDSLTSPFDELFPPREMFEDVDVSSLAVPPMLSHQHGTVSSSMSLNDALDFKTPDYGSRNMGNYLTQSPFSPAQASRASLDMVKAPMSHKTDEIAQIDPKDRRRSSGNTSGNTSAPRPHRSPSTPYSPRKRKSTSSTAGSPTSPTSPSPSASSALQPRKNSHNMIEKRYRTNLNDKIAALRDAVPSLRVMVHRLSRDGCEGGLDDGCGADQLADAESLGGLAPAHKLNKATVLSKATEYIAHLERNNAALIRENSHLRNRNAGLEMIIRGGNGAGMAAGGAWG